MRKIEYRIHKKFASKDRCWYMVIRRISYDNWFRNLFCDDYWRVLCADGSLAYGGWQNGFFSADIEDCEALIKHLKGE